MGECPSRADIGAFLEHALSGEEERELTEHLGECARCREQVEQLRRVDELIIAQACPPEKVRLRVALSEPNGPEPNAASHMRSCPSCRDDLAAVAEALRAQVTPEPPSPNAERLFLERVLSRVGVPLSRIPLEEGAPPLVVHRQLGEIEMELQFAGKYSGLSVAVALRDRVAARPLPGIAVRLRSEDGKESLEAVSDEKGLVRFSLRGLRPASYAIELGTEARTTMTLDIHR